MKPPFTKKSIKLAFGLNENIFVHISDVGKGKKCNCICPDCGSRLIAIKGEKRKYHFRHAVASECEGESVVHSAAKQIIMERKQITLSKHIISVSKKDSRGQEHTEQKTIQDGMVVYFDSVQEEVELQGMRPDILGKQGNNPFIVEIFYRHPVEEEKCKKIEEINISAIEIDLSDLMPEDIQGWEAFWLCINNPQRVRWLHNAKTHHPDYPELEKQLEKKIQEQEAKYKQEEIEKQNRAKQELVHAQHNRLLLFGRPVLRGGPLIDRVRPFNGKETQRSGFIQRKRTFGR